MHSWLTSFIPSIALVEDPNVGILLTGWPQSIAVPNPTSPHSALAEQQLWKVILPREPSPFVHAINVFADGAILVA